MYRKGAQPQFHFETFRRLMADGSRVIYVRFLAADGAILATRSTGCVDDKAASGEILRLLSELDLSALDAARCAKEQAAEEKALTDDARFSSMSILEFIEWYWSDEGYHVTDQADAKKPLSAHYIEDCRFYLKRYISPWPGFEGKRLADVSFALIESFFRYAKKLHQLQFPDRLVSREQLNQMICTIRGPIYWAAARSLCKPVDFKTIVLPAASSRERGILTDKEIDAIVALPTQQSWRPKEGGYLHVDVQRRPRLKGGVKNPEEMAILDVRQKAYVLMGPFCGFRRGEERGLKWKAVDLERGVIIVENNYVDKDGDKAPKKDSYGMLPIDPSLEVVLWELHELAKALGLDGPDDYVLMNPADPTKPASKSVLRSGWLRSLRLIGVSKEEQEARHLVYHGTRHRFATKLVDSGMAPLEAMKMTRHRTLEMLMRYSNHVSEETFEKAREAIKAR